MSGLVKFLQWLKQSGQGKAVLQSLAPIGASKALEKFGYDPYGTIEDFRDTMHAAYDPQGRYSQATRYLADAAGLAVPFVEAAPFGPIGMLGSGAFSTGMKLLPEAINALKGSHSWFRPESVQEFSRIEDDLINKSRQSQSQFEKVQQEALRNARETQAATQQWVKQQTAAGIVPTVEEIKVFRKLFRAGVRPGQPAAPRHRFPYEMIPSIPDAPVNEFGQTITPYGHTPLLSQSLFMYPKQVGKTR